MTEGFDVYAEFVKRLADAEVARRGSLEQKAGAVITTSGTLVTLLFGLVAVITAGSTYSLPREAHCWLVGSLVLFVLAAVIALVVNIPRPYGQAELSKVQLTSSWSDTAEKAQAVVAGLHLKAVEKARHVNDVKAWMLVAAFAAEVVAVFLLAVAIGIVLHEARLP